MYKTIKSFVLPLALASLAPWATVAAQAAEATNSPAASKPVLKVADLFGDTVVAKGKGIEIKRSQLEAEVTRFKSQAAGRGQPVPAEATTEVERYILSQMLQVQLLNSQATEADKTEAKAQAEKRFAEATSKLSAEEMSRELKLLGTSKEDLIAKWAELGSADAVAKRGVKTSASEAEVKQFFEDNEAKFEQPELVRASHILLGTQDPTTGESLPADKKAAKHKQAEDLLKRARAGEDFAKLAKDNSEDPGSKNKGGEYLFGRGQMVKEFETAAFSLNTNQVSEIVTTAYGFHIIKLLEKIPARKAGLEDEVLMVPNGPESSYPVLKQYWHDAETVTNATKVATLIRKSLEGQQFRKEFPAYLEKLRKDSGLEILDEKLKPETSAPASGGAATVPAPADKPKSK